MNQKLLLILGRYTTLNKTIKSIGEQRKSLKEQANFTDDEYMARHRELGDELLVAVNELQSIEIYALIIAELKKMEEMR